MGLTIWGVGSGCKHTGFNIEALGKLAGEIIGITGGDCCIIAGMGMIEGVLSDPIDDFLLIPKGAV